MSFFLVRLEPDASGTMVDVPMPGFGPYEKGSEAAQIAKKLTVENGYKVQPRRISQAPDWRGRQRDRLANGQLTSLPAKWDLPPIEDHFAHLHKGDPTKIAFTESDELGVIDRVTAVTPGRYLTRYYPEVNDADRRRLIASIDPSGEILFATTPEEITRIYKEGPSSCMDADHNFTTPVWPTAVYGAGDLAVAYSMNNRGRIQSRALCWPEKKLYGRVYGDESRFKAALEAEGFTGVWNGKGNFETFLGAKLAKVPVPKQPGWFVSPYFDNIDLAVDRGDHFEIVEKASPGDVLLVSGGTRGMCEMYRYCPRLHDARLSSTFRLVHGVNEEWSSEAINMHAERCQGSGNYYPVDHIIRLANGLRWSREHFEQHGGTCEVTGQRHPMDELVMHKGRLTYSAYVEEPVEDRSGLLRAFSSMPAEAAA